MFGVEKMKLFRYRRCSIILGCILLIMLILYILLPKGLAKERFMQQNEMLHKHNFPNEMEIQRKHNPNLGKSKKSLLYKKGNKIFKRKHFNHSLVENKWINANIKIRDTAVPKVKKPMDGSKAFIIKDVHQALTFKSKKLYQNPDPFVRTFLSNKERLVHLDLKGAPPKISYYEKLFPLLQHLGATGLLIEYEGMFPYSGILSTLANQNSYSVSDIQRIQALAQLNNFEVIPLVQTLGNMEFTSLHEKDSPLLISSTRNATNTLIFQMIDQVMKLHPKAAYFHIGCSEVNFNEEQSKGFLRKYGITKDQLFFNHIAKVAGHILKKYVHVKPIVWDDIFRNVKTAILMRSGLKGLVEPMVWDYSASPQTRLPPDIWFKYDQVFSHVWIASAFKGTTGCRQTFPNIKHYLLNQYGWVELLKNAKISKANFRGITLTGMQRKNHACELLPLSLPSLAVCLGVVRTSGFTTHDHKLISGILSCFPLINLYSPKTSSTLNCSFAGSEIYKDIERFSLFNNIIHRQLKNTSSQTKVVQLQSASKYLSKFKRNIVHHMQSVFNADTIAEWINVNVNKLDKYLKSFKKGGQLNNRTKIRLPNTMKTQGKSKWLRQKNFGKETLNRKPINSNILKQKNRKVNRSQNRPNQSARFDIKQQNNFESYEKAYKARNENKRKNI